MLPGTGVQDPFSSLVLWSVLLFKHAKKCKKKKDFSELFFFVIEAW
jgi:hypothetical protein